MNEREELLEQELKDTQAERDEAEADGAKFRVRNRELRGLLVEAERRHAAHVRALLDSMEVGK